MSKTIERELTDAELDAVSGGDLALSHEATHSSSSGGGSTVGCGGGGFSTVVLGLRKSSGGQTTGVFF